MNLKFNDDAYPYAKDRYEASVKRNPDSFCPNHPMILAENEEKIRWAEGGVTEKDGEVTRFRYCPKCHISKIIE